MPHVGGSASIMQEVLTHGHSRMLPTLSIVIPAFNEQESIEATIDEALIVGARVAAKLEVLVCDDGSVDATRAIVEARAQSEPRLRVLSRPKNRGIEASLRTLYANARHEWVFLMSADRQWPMTSLLAMTEAVERGADFVIGLRTNKRAVYTPYRRLVSWTYERIVRALGAPGGDPGSIKLAHRYLLHVPVAAQGVFAEGERVIRSARSGALVVEIPVEFRGRVAGKATGARRDVVIRALVDAVRVTSSLALGWPTPELPDSDV